MVAVVPVLATIVDHVEPPSDDLSISYPVIGDPLWFVGADHDRLICDDDIVVACRFCGVDGTVTLSPNALCGSIPYDANNIEAKISVSKYLA